MATISPPPSKRRPLSSTHGIAAEPGPGKSSSLAASPAPSPPFPSLSPTHAPSALAPSLPSRPITELQQDEIRIFTWNVNGISPFLQPTITNFFRPTKRPLSRSRSSSPDNASSSADLRACLRRWKWPQIVCLQEVKIPRRDIKTQQAVRQAVKGLGKRHDATDEQEPSYTAHFSLPRDKYNARGFGGKVYGVCTLIRDNPLSGEQLAVDDLIKEVPWDLEGRVLVVEIPRRKVTVFNIYAVNGTDNPYRNTQTGQIIGTRHDRKRAFHAELKMECESYERKGWAVVIAGDLNIARSPLDGFPGRRMGQEHMRNRIDFEEKFIHGKEYGGLGMVDSFRALHDGEKKYSYRGRNGEWGSSCDRVDLILVSGESHANGRMTLKEADILDEEMERGPSDHVPLYITIEAVEHEKAKIDWDDMSSVPVSETLVSYLGPVHTSELLHRKIPHRE
ncbi:hypothetical protein MMC30_004331 [Trapelia coarctata]|nr:hypothetical protein [Trapelia coarctata]